MLYMKTDKLAFAGGDRILSFRAAKVGEGQGAWAQQDPGEGGHDAL